ncbi:Cdc6/Cdc18 family protein [Halomarina rubra]|uniref:ORC1-type DNA replication protein n=1 Tax=Halomarina rubra TaxID=2071873 RepID=A0ABD6B0R4_9EURY|nr:orc1/cdc6 family replication initiation protein [Halomarina rubra]
MPTNDAHLDPAPPEERNTLFDYTDTVFDDEDLLEIGHLPDPERIVGRDEHMQKVADALNPAIFGSAPSHLFIFGKTGTGKTLISRSVTEMLQTEADREGVTVQYAFIDCGEKNTEASVVKRVAQSLNDPERTEFTVPERGLATGDYYERLWTVLDTCTDVAIVILDEIDMLEDDEVLRKLSRASENRRINSARIGVIGISNKIDYPDQMSERVKSSFSRDELVFPPYDANQLGEILENRRDAFHDGVLTEDAIPLAAALAAQEHGDARKAIDILRNAGRIAKRVGHDTVTEDHIRQAKQKTEVDRLAELIDGSPLQAKVLLYALTKLTTNNDRVEFTSREIYHAYTQTTNAIDLDALSERRTRELLQEQDFLNVIDSTKESRGRGEGVTGKHRLLESPDIVLKVLLRDDRLEQLEP